MSLSDINQKEVTKLVSQLLDHVTCIECCKVYARARRAACGHGLCGACWAGRRACPRCAAAVRGGHGGGHAAGHGGGHAGDRPLQATADSVAALLHAYEKLFNVNLQELMLEEPNASDDQMDPNKNVKQWLTSSQNHFSAPVTDSQESQPPPPVQVSADVLIHTNFKKATAPSKVASVNAPQEDWDKIEVMPDTEDVTRDKENVVGPMDLEPFLFDDEYSNEHPRRSSRKRDNKNEGKEINSKTSNTDSEKKSTTAPQTWNNVKKMRKEFSKLNKKNKNKLNVSIEMCKKTQNSSKKAAVTPPVLTQLPTYTIDEDTPDVTLDQNKSPKELRLNKEQENNVSSKLVETTSGINNKQSTEVIDIHLREDVEIYHDNVMMKENDPNAIKEKMISDNKVTLQSGLNHSDSQKKNSNTLMPFIKKGTLCTAPHTDKRDTATKTVAPTPASISTDDIEITIKIGNTITNIVINKKQNDVKLNVNTDKEIQTSLAPQIVTEQTTTSKSTDSAVNNLQINICGNIAQTQVHTADVASKKPDVQSASTKKNTASAETGTAHFEITASVEREISNIMDRVQHNDDKTKPDDKTTLIPQQEATKEIPLREETDVIAQDVKMCNDDIFASGSIKEVPVQVISTSKSAHSEIFITKSRTQKTKRTREDNDGTQSKKKLKRVLENNSPSKTATLPDSEAINYDTVMGQVFASIDKDIEIIKSQSETNAPENTQKINSVKDKCSAVVATQSTVRSGKKVDEKTVRVCENEKFSENVFSMVERDSEPLLCTPRGNHKQVPGPETQRHIAGLLTPGVLEALRGPGEDEPGEDDPGEDDPGEDDPGQDVPGEDVPGEDDRSVVEDTPHKDISIPKASKQKRSPPTTRVTAVSADGACDGSAAPADTPLDMDKFADHVVHKSTPLARKSLNFTDDTLCPTIAPHTTQEKEFLSRALSSPSPQPPQPPQYVVAASCVVAAELAALRAACGARGWSFLRAYSDRLTHLVVAVDAENRAQRSVKYMRAVAAGRWVVSVHWIRALQLHQRASEEEFEVLDSSGAPGPRRSRVSRRQSARALFAGLGFYCMPPYTVLQKHDLEAMLVDCGGEVVDSPRGGSLLLVEPQHEHDQRYTYVALESGAVPLHVEWALECIAEHRLLPPQLLPPAALHAALPAPLRDLLDTEDSGGSQ